MDRSRRNARLAISAPLGDAGQTLELARHAQQQGYEEIWLAEVAGGDAYALAGALAVAVPGLPIGTAVTPAQTRTPFVHAMAAMTLSQLTHGNFVLGLGLSSPNIVADWAGQPYDQPLLRMREHLQVLRGLLRGERVDFAGKTLSAKRAKLGGAPDGDVPIYLGALNDKMLRMTGELADGVTLNMVPESALPQVLGAVRAGAEAAGRDPGRLEVVSRLHVILTDDEAGARNLVRQVFGAYAATPGYNRFFRWIGFEEEGEQIARCFANKDREGVAKAVTDALCDAMAVVGGPETLRARVRAYAEAGVDVCVINPIGDAAHVKRTVEVLSGCLDGLELTTGGVLRGTPTR